jgi:hypothetical protein
VGAISLDILAIYGSNSRYQKYFFYFVGCGKAINFALLLMIAQAGFIGTGNFKRDLP